MTSGYSILTRKIKGIDVHVWLTMLTIIIISGATLIYKITKKVDCNVFETYVMDESGSKTNSLYINEKVFFTANVSGNVSWDFGDGVSEKGKNAKHTFLHDGEQTVTVTLNGACPQIMALNIHKDTVKTEDPADIHPISGPETALVGKKATFEYIGTKKPHSLEWTLVNSNDYTLKLGNTATFTFRFEGNQIVQLQLDNDPTKVYKKLVVVLAAHNEIVSRPPPVIKVPRQPQPGPVKPQADTPKTVPVKALPAPPTIEAAPKMPFKPDNWYRAQFDEVIAGQKTAEVFQNYLCDNFGKLETPVKVGAKTETVQSICEKFYKSKCKITYFQVERDVNNCVSRFDIKYDERKGLFKRIFGSNN